jgi:hypothetical protein
MTNPVLDALKETTVLACVSTRALGLERTDNTASAKVIEDNHAVTKAAKVKVNRLAGADAIHKDIVSLQGEASATLRRYSQPFGEEEKWRLLPNALFERVIGELAPIKAKYDEKIEELRGKAAEILAQAGQNIGTFNVELPSIDEMINSYQLTTDFRPIPESANFRGLNENTVNKLREMHDHRLAAAVEMAERNSMERVLPHVERFIDRMKAYEEKMLRDEQDPDNKDKTGIFRDTVVTNIQEFADVLGAFNISGDPRLTQLGNDIREFGNIKPKQLRESALVRAEATSRAQEIVGNLNSWLGGN